MVCNIPDAQCMAYLPTFAINVMVNVGKYTIHWASGIWLNILSHLLSPSPSKCRERPFPIRSTRPIVVVQGDSGIRRKGGKKLSWDLPPQNNDVSVRFEKSFKYLMSCFFLPFSCWSQVARGNDSISLHNPPMLSSKVWSDLRGLRRCCLTGEREAKKRKKTSRSSGTNPGVKGCHSISAVRWPPGSPRRLKIIVPNLGWLKFPTKTIVFGENLFL